MNLRINGCAKPGLRKLRVRVRVGVNVAGVTTASGVCRAEQMGNCVQSQRTIHLRQPLSPQ